VPCKCYTRSTDLRYRSTALHYWTRRHRQIALRDRTMTRSFISATRSTCSANQSIARNSSNCVATYYDKSCKIMKNRPTSLTKGTMKNVNSNAAVRALPFSGEGQPPSQTLFFFFFFFLFSFFFSHSVSRRQKLHLLGSS